jgi:hypothetical protein
MRIQRTIKKRKTVATVVVFAVLLASFSPIFAVSAKAQFVVWDPGNFVPNVAGQTKDYGLDAVAWTLVNVVIERMAASTVNWINSGFEGSPAFVTNPSAYFTDIGDKIAGQYIFSNPNLNFLCGPISAKIRLALAQNYLNERVWQCTLTEVGRNIEDFMDDFSNGGWDSFFEITQNQHMNPIGAYLQAESEMFEQIASEKDLADKDLLQGKGFLSYKKCKENATKICMGVDASGNCADYDCAEADKETLTPGSVISDQLNNVLNTGNNKLAAADEINEIVSALLNQLINHVVGGIGSGLRGLSGSDSNDSQSFTSQLLNNNSLVDYFGNTQDTSILDVPLPNDSSFGATYMEAQNCGYMNLNWLIENGYPLSVQVECTASCQTDPYSCLR